MSLTEKYLKVKEEFEAVKKEIESQFDLPKGTLVLFKGKHYRTEYCFVDDKTGEPYITLKEIKNYRINWQSCSTPRIKLGDEFKVVEWEFDYDKAFDLSEAYYASDSVNERADLREQYEQMFLDCHHDWYKHNLFADEYECKCCGSTTYVEKTKDWLNGESEDVNIVVPEL